MVVEIAHMIEVGRIWGYNHNAWEGLVFIVKNMDFLQDSSKIQPFDQDFFSNFQYLFSFGPIHQELVS